MKPVVKVSNIWKKYEIGKERKYLSLRDQVWQFSNFFKNNAKSEFYALEDVSFDLFPGESLGIIGRNGAGKSTLLKILSQITPPTKGEVILRGRMSSLLEVGTGFHPELTGRENVYFNGAILGMSRAEIKSKFDEIVQFSEIGPFIDEPLKFYSSGMQMRLAFSVAAHLQTEVFVIDEVLAVGDIAFQQKCIEKIKEIGNNSNRTLIFVTHDYNTLFKLCSRSLVLDNGKILFDGASENAVDFYAHRVVQNKVERLGEIKKRNGTQAIRIIDGNIQCNTSKSEFIIRSLEDFILTIQFEITNLHSVVSDCKLDIGFNTSLGQRIAWISQKIELQKLNEKYYKLSIKIKSFPLKPGMYDLNLHLSSGGIVLDWLKNVLRFEVSKGNHPEIPSDQGFVVLDYEKI